MALLRSYAAPLAAVAVLVTAGCATGEAGATSGPSDEITIGVIAPFSGFSANYGPEAQAGVELALEEAGYSAGGATLDVVFVDEDVLDPSQTLERVKKAVEGDGADVLIGPVFGSSQQAVAPYLSQRKLPMFSFLGGQSSLAGERSGFIWPAPDDQTARPLGTYAGEDLGYDTIATLGPDYAYGHDTMNGAAEAFEATGGTVVQQQWVPLGTTDMLQYATSLDRDVDALVMWLVPTDAAAFVREYRNLGIDVPLLMFQGVFDPTYQEIGYQLVGTIGLNEYNPLLDYPENQAFVAAYEAEVGGVPNQTTAFAYTATEFVVQGLTNSGTDPSVDALREALAGHEFDTVIGPARFDADGIASSNRVVVRAAEADGAYIWEPLKTYESVGADR